MPFYVVLRLGLLMMASWMFMITVGVAHAEWVPALPTIGYGTSFGLVTAGYVMLLLTRIFELNLTSAADAFKSGWRNGRGSRP